MDKTNYVSTINKVKIPHDIKLVGKMIDGIIYHYWNIYKKEKPGFTIIYKWDYDEYVHSIGDVVLVYESSFIYLFPGGKQIVKPYFKSEYMITAADKMSDAKQHKQIKLFVESIVQELFLIVGLGIGCLDTRSIVDGTAELGVNEKKTPVELMNELQDESLGT